MKLTLRYLLISISILAPIIQISGQTKEIVINESKFIVEYNKSDTLNGGDVVNVDLYRNNKKLLSHTILKEEGDCSLLSVELGQYEVINNSIIFYTYWAITDRMPSLLVPFGFRKQIYSVEKGGNLRLSKSEIYIEDYLENGNPKYYNENEGWNHFGLKFLNKKVNNDFEQRALDDYIKNIELKYNSQFVLGLEKKKLELEVRKVLKKEIKQKTGAWINGDIYGNVKK